jgi:Fe-S-cluster containining protein
VQDGYVYSDDEEIARMAAHLGQTPAEFWARYGVRVDTDSGRPILEAKDGRGCPLLTPDRRCSVHAVKPSQCATWPFWPEMLSDREEWDAAKSFCPGLDRQDAPRYTKIQIRAIEQGRRGT